MEKMNLAQKTILIANGARVFQKREASSEEFDKFCTDIMLEVLANNIDTEKEILDLIKERTAETTLSRRIVFIVSKDQTSSLPDFLTKAAERVKATEIEVTMIENNIDKVIYDALTVGVNLPEGAELAVTQGIIS